MWLPHLLRNPLEKHESMEDRGAQKRTLGSESGLRTTSLCLCTWN